MAYGKIKTVKTPDRTYLYFLTSMVGAVGFGSAIFHAIPNHVTILFDVVPIYIFLLSALVFLLRCLTSSWMISISACVVYVIALVAATVFVPDDLLNGSFRHAITLVTLLIILAYNVKKHRAEGMRLLGIVLLYAAAITFRSIDVVTCNTHHIGTHFLWHTLNAAAAYFAVLFLMRFSKVANPSNTDVNLANT